MQRMSTDGTGTRELQGTPAVPRNQRQPRRASRFLILLVSVVLLGNALVGERGLISLIRADRQVAAVSGLIDALRAENDDLRERLVVSRARVSAASDAAIRSLAT